MARGLQPPDRAMVPSQHATLAGQGVPYAGRVGSIPGGDGIAGDDRPALPTMVVMIVTTALMVVAHEQTWELRKMTPVAHRLLHVGSIIGIAGVVGIGVTTTACRVQLVVRRPTGRRFQRRALAVRPARCRAARRAGSMS